MAKRRQLRVNGGPEGRSERPLLLGLEGRRPGGDLGEDRRQFLGHPHASRRHLGELPHEERIGPRIGEFEVLAENGEPRPPLARRRLARLRGLDDERPVARLVALGDQAGEAARLPGHADRSPLSVGRDQRAVHGDVGHGGAIGLGQARVKLQRRAR
jgi:hypothetical protein